MRQESAFRPDARSSAGAVGLMQLMPRTAELAARELGLEYRRDQLTRPSYNLELGAFYLSKLLGTFERRTVLALASYNAGPHAAARWLSGAHELDADLWTARIPYAETRRYVARVMTNWARYRYLAGGPEQIPELTLELPPSVELPFHAY
jgi:soluble lytic murein transglycosylase